MNLKGLNQTLHRIVHWSSTDVTPHSEPTRALAGERDLYEVSTWEPRTRLDGAAMHVEAFLREYWKLVVVALLSLLVAISFVVSSVVILFVPGIIRYTLLSVLAAIAITVYLWYAFVSPQLPIKPLVVTFGLGIFASVMAGVWNTTFRPLAAIPVVGTLLLMFLIAAPGEEVAKLLAVRLYAYTDDRLFARVVDGAVYGAVAGLAFAASENFGYIVQEAISSLRFGPFMDPTAALGDVAVERALSAPGHVIYSAFAGYYLGLARFNREHASAIVVKGLLVVVLVHATFNVFVVGTLPALLGVGDLGASVLTILYDGALGYILYRKLARYRDAYRTATDRGRSPPTTPDSGYPPSVPPETVPRD
ncbi:PrsW family intramembrane metalloprotease [Haloarchaeobius sp. TZWWS8]|uniref:PrsW family intramembrane metalloprotease n=1 Tax=Haloarchaeobius sp. TZWWS8 TaxID=3446121 RepID=UPI003EB8B578